MRSVRGGGGSPGHGGGKRRGSWEAMGSCGVIGWKVVEGRGRWRWHVVSRRHLPAPKSCQTNVCWNFLEQSASLGFHRFALFLAAFDWMGAMDPRRVFSLFCSQLAGLARVFVLIYAATSGQCVFRLRYTCQ